MLGHAGWVVSERFSNTAQFSDNLTKLYKSHTFKGGYIYQDIFFGSTQPPYARGEYNWDGRYTSVVNQTDDSTSRAMMLLSQIPSLVPGGVDYSGGMNVIQVSPFGSVDAFKTYHGAYAQDSWRVNERLTVNARPPLGLLQPRTGAPGRTVQHGAWTAGAVSDSCGAP